MNNSLSKYFNDSTRRLLKDATKIYPQAKSRNSLSTVTHSKINLPKVSDLGSEGSPSKSPNLTFGKKPNKIEDCSDDIYKIYTSKAYRPKKKIVHYSGSDNEKLPSSYL